MPKELDDTMELEDIPLGQPSPTSSEDQKAAAPLSNNESPIAAGPLEAPTQEEFPQKMTGPPPSYWSEGPPGGDIRAYRGGETNAAKLGQEYKLVVQILTEAWVLPDLTVRTQDELQENLIIARRYLEDIAFFLRGWHPDSDFDNAMVVRTMLNRALKMRAICRGAERESKIAGRCKA